MEAPPSPRVWCWITGKMEEGKWIPCLLHSHLSFGGGQRWEHSFPLWQVPGNESGAALSLT